MIRNWKNENKKGAVALEKIIVTAALIGLTSLMVGTMTVNGKIVGNESNKKMENIASKTIDSMGENNGIENPDVDGDATTPGNGDEKPVVPVVPKNDLTKIVKMFNFTDPYQRERYAFERSEWRDEVDPFSDMTIYTNSSVVSGFAFELTDNSKHYLNVEKIQTVYGDSKSMRNYDGGFNISGMSGYVYKPYMTMKGHKNYHHKLRVTVTSKTGNQETVLQKDINIINKE